MNEDCNLLLLTNTLCIFPIYLLAMLLLASIYSYLVWRSHTLRLEEEGSGDMPSLPCTEWNAEVGWGYLASYCKPLLKSSTPDPRVN